jgi:hypothetical protein
MKTKTMMNDVGTSPQSLKPSRPKVRRLGSAKATSPVQPLPGTIEEKTESERVPATSLHSHNPAPTDCLTVIEAKIDVGLGNRLFIRGQGDGLSWFEGTPLDCIDANTWVWSTNHAREKVVFKLLLNDQVWAKGEDVVVEAGRKLELVPSF